MERVPTPVRSRKRACEAANLGGKRVKVAVDFSRLEIDQDSVIKYFWRIIGIVGCSRDMYVVARAWHLCCSALAASLGTQEFPEMPVKPATTQQSDLPSEYKAVIVGAVSLAIDVAADFEAEYVVSGLTWGHLLYCEIAGITDTVDHTDGSVKSVAGTGQNARQLMRMKLVISQALSWQLRDPSVADSFALLFNQLVECGCTGCSSLRTASGIVNAFVGPILHSLAYILLPQGTSALAIALAVLWVARETVPTGSVSGSPASIKRTLAVVRRVVDRSGLNACVGQLGTESARKRATEILLDKELHADVYSLTSRPVRPKPLLVNIDCAYQDTLDLVDTENNY